MTAAGGEWYVKEKSSGPFGDRDAGRKSERMEKKRLRPWMAVIFVIAYGLDIFVLSGFLAQWFGIWGTLLHELVLVLLAVGLAVLLGADTGEVFPFRRPRLSCAAGTVLLWLGTFLAAMAVTMLTAYFFPSRMLEAGQSVQSVMTGLPLVLSLFLVALTPAVCEEMAFRGGFLGCLKSQRSRWPGILIVAAVFGAFHGSIWRFIPTFILGIALGYLLIETENLFYSMLFHFINNGVPVLLVGLLSQIQLPQTETAGQQAALLEDHLPLAAAAVYVMLSCGAPLLIYIGRYLIHRGQPGFDRGLFPAGQKKTLSVLLGVSVYIFLIGIILYAGSLKALMETTGF